MVLSLFEKKLSFFGKNRFTSFFDKAISKINKTADQPLHGQPGQKISQEACARGDRPGRPQAKDLNPDQHEFAHKRTKI